MLASLRGLKAPVDPFLGPPLASFLPPPREEALPRLAPFDPAFFAAVSFFCSDFLPAVFLSRFALGPFFGFSSGAVLLPLSYLPSVSPLSASTSRFSSRSRVFCSSLLVSPFSCFLFLASSSSSCFFLLALSSAALLRCCIRRFCRRGGFGGRSENERPAGGPVFTFEDVGEEDFAYINEGFSKELFLFQDKTGGHTFLFSDSLASLSSSRGRLLCEGPIALTGTCYGDC